jgi:hypothetical protein
MPIFGTEHSKPYSYRFASSSSIAAVLKSPTTSSPVSSIINMETSRASSVVSVETPITCEIVSNIKLFVERGLGICKVGFQCKYIVSARRKHLLGIGRVSRVDGASSSGYATPTCCGCATPIRRLCSGNGSGSGRMCQQHFSKARQGLASVRNVQRSPLRHWEVTRIKIK